MPMLSNLLTPSLRTHWNACQSVGGVSRLTGPGMAQAGAEVRPARPGSVHPDHGEREPRSLESLPLACRRLPFPLPVAAFHRLPLKSLGRPAA